jgi:murein DD-endopeptidase MepM/ murein hydrolase activator NlpD
MNVRRFVFSLALAASLGPAFAGAAAAATAPPSPRVVAEIGDKIKEKEADLESIRKHLADKRRQLHFQELRKEDLARQVADTNAHIAGVTATLEELNAQVRWNERKLAWNEIQLRAAEATLQRHNDALKRRLVDAYERGDLGYLNVLLASASFTDFVERWDDVRFLVAANQRAVRERRAAELAVSGAEQRLQSERTALDDVVQQRERDRAALAALAVQRSQLLEVAEIARRGVAAQVTQLEEVSASEEAALEQLIRERQREAEAKREEERRAAQLAGREIPQDTTSGGPGTLTWPVSGPITSPFGMRADPNGHGFRMHTGMDIAAPTGQTIVSAAGGRIIFAGWYGGYGNAIIVDHGGQTSTLYGHCSQIFVAVGQEVQRGQAIGAVGATGDATGPHLHFEVRINGVPVDPAGHLR